MTVGGRPDPTDGVQVGGETLREASDAKRSMEARSFVWIAPFEVRMSMRQTITSATMSETVKLILSMNHPMSRAVARGRISWVLMWKKRVSLLGLSLFLVAFSTSLQAMPIIRPAIILSPAAAGEGTPESLLERCRQRRQTALFEDALIEAEDLCRRALDMYRELGDRAGEAEALIERGLIALQRRQFQKAKDDLHRAVEMAHTVGDVILQARANEHLGQVYAAVNETSPAIMTIERALSLYEQAREWRGAFNALSRLAEIVEREGQVDQAIEFAQRALTVARRIGDWTLIGRASGQLAEAYDRKGQHERAWRAAQQALIAHRRARDRWNEGRALARLGEMARNANRPDQAMRLYRQALDIASRITDTDLEWRLHARLGQLHLDRGEDEQARSSFEAAVKALEATPSILMVREEDDIIPIRPSELFHRYADLLLQSDRSQVDRAWILLERGRARAFQDWMAEARIRIRRGVDPLRLERERILLQRLDEVHRALRAPGLSEAERAALVERWYRTQVELERFRRDIRRVESRYAELRYPRSVSVERLRQRTITPETALLAYMLDEPRSYLMVVTSKASTVRELPPRRQVERMVEAYYRLLSRTSSSNDLIAAGRRLYDVLLGPAERVLQDVSHLIIVPDGWLYYLPFETLIRPSPLAGDRDWQYVLETATIAYLPSASVLDWLRQQPVNEAPRDRLLVVRGSFVPVPSAPKRQSERSFSGSEIRALNRALGTRYVDVWALRSANGERAEPPGWSRYRLLHLMSPYVIDEREPVRSGIPGQPSGTPSGDNPFSMLSLFNTPLRTQAVIMSHARPVWKETVTGWGMTSLARGFFYAGVPVLVLTLWDGEETSTAEFMEAFYRSLRAGENIQTALRAAKLKLWRMNPYRHPRYWARFVIVGDGERRVAITAVGCLVVLLAGVAVFILLLALGLVARRRSSTIGMKVS
ncbi:MAG: CHAT domain-containing protein [Acidobacteria bacterium]|nr:MAG: CHAT domain-containing protein [Acidobacteriota bacterium]